jgi:methane/ammonia monooxygenase subunit C
MAATSASVTTAVAGERPLLDTKNLIFALAIYNIFYVYVRWYEGVFGWSAGLDAFAPEFDTYWMTILKFEVPLEFLCAGSIAAWMWKTRTRDMASVSKREILRRHFHHFVWLVAYAEAIYWGASYFTEQDGTWHQTIVRDTDFTPSHVIEFYMTYPIYIITGIGAFMYAYTRIPFFNKAVSLPYMLVVIGPFMIFPNVGLNEWGHTFWWMEELFVAPLHYGFVFFGWFALGILGLFRHIFEDLSDLIGKDVCPDV